MNRILTIWFITLAVIIIATPTVYAGPDIYLGVGLHSASFSKDLQPGKIVSIMPGPGGALNFGFSLSSKLDLDFRLGRTSQKEEISTSRVHFDWIEAGPLWHMITKGKIRPFLSAGIGSYKVDTTGLDFKGTGYFANLGIEELLNEHHSAKLYFEGSWWKDDDYDLEVEAFHVGLLYNYSF